MNFARSVSLLSALSRARALHMKSVSISAAFDGGNIERVGSASAEGPVQLNIRPDPFTELEQKTHKQWFSFRSSAHSSAAVVRYEIVNAGSCSYPSAWPGSEVCVSTDRHNWHRVASTVYDEASGVLAWEFDHGAVPGGTAFFAYFDPFSYERHLDLVSRCAAAAGATVRSLGQTLDGRELEVVEVGTGGKHCWVVHRQHPGEPQAEHFAQGLLTRLLGLTNATLAAPGTPALAVPLDGLAVRLRSEFTFHIVPNMNPDGSVRGHLRTNAGGVNLNREWAPSAAALDGAPYAAPSLERSPEVFHTLAAMDLSGVDAFLDVHGDEELPVAFVSGAEGCPNWSARIEALQGAFLGAFGRANPDTQAAFGYEPDPPKGGNLAICSNQVAARFDCLSVTFEMPFKDNAAGLSAHTSFQGPRCAALGASFLDALAHVAPQLRGVDAPAFPLPDDAYIKPNEGAADVRRFVGEQRAKLGRSIVG